jgi:hypothetical protein
MFRHIHKQLLAGGAALALTACGASGGGVTAEFVPPPPGAPAPTPAPTPAPAPAPVIAPEHLGLVSAAPFSVLSIGDTYKTDSTGQNATRLTAPAPQDVQFGYDASTNSYRISLPGFEPGTLADTGYSGSAGQLATSSGSHVTSGSSTTLQPLFVDLFVPGSSFSPYSYTSFGSWNGKTDVTAAGDILRADGIFAYGIPTQPGDVPITGSANYSAQIRGSIGADWMLYVTGTANLSFDFAGGKLSGSMHPGVFDTFDGIIMDFGKYDFTQTVYATGGTTFSGKFIVPGLPNADSSFEGNFTGPNAAEVMARFQAPYVFDGKEGSVFGVWIGKKN